MPVDEKATRFAVEEYLETVRQYRQIGFVRREAAITQAYSYREHQSTNAISKQTEDIATYNVDKEAELQAKDRLLDLAMSKLSSMQREVIQRRYLDDEDEFNAIICNEMDPPISDRTFRRIKTDAIGILAGALKLTRYTDEKAPIVEYPKKNEPLESLLRLFSRSGRHICTPKNFVFSEINSFQWPRNQLTCSF
ncbi:ArpU family phage packaging/lysis transcriptional regulator [Paenibacillus terrae]|uniref:ArpU family phage packaging/lysis transcriptional regulator n=1 Tax=Paenibacillus terrae TaxID=159743 RepID=UPI001F436E0F|nr:ArpU family phage packaging/lysis transcriptional regulator [Paenibacillus terrae]